MESTRLVKTNLPNGTSILIEAILVSEEQDVAAIENRFEDLIGPLEGIATAVSEAIAKIKPKKASVELGIEVGLESGKLTALLVKGTGKANLKVVLGWEN
jgi:Trypsin-co-occurring domain 1